MFIKNLYFKQILSFLFIGTILNINLFAKEMTQLERDQIAAKLIPIIMYILEDKTEKLTINGIPQANIPKYSRYNFKPNVTGNVTYYTIENKPDWAKFNTTTGILSGIPRYEGTYTNILIHAHHKNQVSTLGVFSITVTPAINLAYQFGEVRQGSTYDDSRYPALNVIDGNHNNFNHTLCNNTDNWLEITLPKHTKVAHIIIHNRPNSMNRLNNAKLYINNSPYVNETHLNINNLAATLSDQKTQEFIFTPRKEGQYLFLKANGSNCLHVSEIEIYGESNQTDTLATKPIIIKNIKEVSFQDEDRSFILKYDKDGTLSSSCASIIPNKIYAHRATTFTFEDIDVGSYKECNITITHTNGTQSKPVTLNNFIFQKVLATTKLRGRSDGKGLDYVIIADGFQENEMALFRTKAVEYANYIMDYDSNLSLERNAWNIFTIETVSKESGADNIDKNNGTQVDTAVDSYFWCAGISRLLCINGSKAASIASKYVPQYDKVLVIINSNKYGGAGGGYATASLGAGGNVVVHELGHSLAGLADEYTYGGSNPPSSEPNQVNVTINNDLETVKWKYWLDKSEVGLYEGGKYVTDGVWRPTNTSIMRSNGQPFYYINAEQWALSVYRVAGVTYTKLPKSSKVIQTDGENTTFTVEPSMGSSAQKIIWQVDNIKQNVSENTFTFVFGANKHKNYKVKAIINDKTGVIRKDDYKYSSETIEWDITIN